MAVFLTTRGTTSELERIINSAERFLVLISPFIRMPSSLFQNLKAADRQGVKISIVYGKSEPKPDTLKQLAELANAKLYFLKDLHAKCYFNEKSMIITSLNLYDFSEINNREMGVLVQKEDADNVYEDAVKEARLIVDQADRCDPNTQTTKAPVVQVRPPEEQKKRESIWRRPLSEVLSSFIGKTQGFCIGCRERLEFDEEKPYCLTCYAKWRRNMRQKGSYCHECGKKATTTINKVRCRACYEVSAL